LEVIIQQYVEKVTGAENIKTVGIQKIYKGFYSKTSYVGDVSVSECCGDAGCIKVMVVGVRLSVNPHL
jgi:hypothetical protein